MTEKSEGAKTKNISLAEPVLSWESPEFTARKKEPMRFIVIGAVALVLAATLYWQKLFSGALLSIVAAVVFAIVSSVRPKTVHCALYQEGLVVDSKTYQYNQFKSFDFIFADIPKLRLDLVGKYSGEVTLPLKGMDIDRIRAIIVKHLPEESKGEDMVDMINRWIKF